MLRSLVLLFLMITVGFGLQGCGRSASPEESCNFVQNSEAQRVSWSNTVPIYMRIDSTVPKEFRDAIKRAASAWNAISHRELVRIREEITTTRPANDQNSVIYWMSTWEGARSYEQARTTVYWKGDQIYEADIRINAKDFKYVDGRGPGMIDFESLLIHEFGHVLGLAHNEIGSSVMAMSLASNTERREVSDDDQKSLRCEY